MKTTKDLQPRICSKADAKGAKAKRSEKDNAVQ